MKRPSAHRLPHRRTILKVVHWAVLPLFLWFTFVQPRDVERVGQWAVDLHSVFGLVFVSIALLWWGSHLRLGLAGRPGPKLKPWARTLHRALHLTLVWGMMGVALTGFGLGLTSSVLLWAGNIVPIAPPLGLPRLNDIVGTIHAVEFYLLGLVVVVHAAFHVWRHVVLRDNALRIMAPRVLHRYL